MTPIPNQPNPFTSPVPTAISKRLVGQGFVGASIDTNYWTATLVGSGSSVQANAIL
jgi:hypothetical protein